jgi:O-antigen/teichoic acid export membrane protein
LGIFASISQVVFIGNLLTTSIGTTFSRSISKAFHSGDDKQAQKILVKMIIMVIIIYGLGLLFSVVAGKEILIGLFTEQYSNYGSLLNQIILSYFALALASVTGYFLTALCEYKIQIVAWTLGILVNIIISTQTNRLGLVAGAYGLGFSSLLVFIFNLIWYRIKFLKRGTGQ